jgi:PIN domain nuclease of toxin-antitoxin system
VDYLLDTCTFLWYAQRPAMLSAAAVTALNDPGSGLFLSDASLWEITLKHSAGTLPLPDAPRVWVPEKLAYHQVNAAPLTHDTFFRSGELPRIHSDLFDRLIAAQAMELSLAILSPDVPLSLLGASRIW